MDIKPVVLPDSTDPGKATPLPVAGLFDPSLLREIRSRFCHVDSDPHLGRRVFLENAGGALKLRSVIDAQSLSSSLPSNSGRDNDGSRAVEADIARGKRALADFLHVKDGVVISGDSTTSHAFRIFDAATSGAGPGGNVVCTDLDHACFFDAAAHCAKRYGLTRRVVPMDTGTGTVTPDAMLRHVDADTVAVSVIHASNITGGKNDLAAIVEAVRRKAPDAYILADGAQHVQHASADVSALGVDAYVFSAYKVFSVPGYAFAYLSPRAANLPHAKLAGKRVDEWDLGTRDQAAYACFEEVVKYLCWLGRRSRPDLPDTASRRTILKAAFDAIEAHEIALGGRLLYGTGGLPGLLTHKSVTIYGDKSASDKREAVYAFSIDGLDTKEAVRGFVQRNVIVHDRVSDAYSGHTLARLGIDAVTRVSLAHYNTIEEVDHFLFALNEIIRDVVTYDA